MYLGTVNTALANDRFYCFMDNIFAQLGVKRSPLLSEKVISKKNSKAKIEDFSIISIQGLMKKGFSEEVSKKLALYSPKLVKKILQSKNGGAVTVYRGIDIDLKDFQDFASARMNIFGQQKLVWVTTSPESALHPFATFKPNKGILVEYQIPKFMLRDPSNPKQILSAIEKNGQIVPDGSEHTDSWYQPPFINRIGILKPHQNGALEEFPTHFHIHHEDFSGPYENYIDSWISYPLPH